MTDQPNEYLEELQKRLYAAQRAETQNPEPQIKALLDRIPALLELVEEARELNERAINILQNYCDPVSKAVRGDLEAWLSRVRGEKEGEQR